jgi:glycine C-acetyltransferase
MAQDKLKRLLVEKLDAMERNGVRKGKERIITGRRLPRDGFGPRYFLKSWGGRAFLTYECQCLPRHQHPPSRGGSGRNCRPALRAGPGAVRFISGTFEPHIMLEERLASFHGREAGNAVQWPPTPRSWECCRSLSPGKPWW